MPYVIAVLGPAGKIIQGSAFQAGWLKAYDPEFADGRGWFDTTTKLSEAQNFASAEDAIACWKQVPKANPWRPDGKPNRPLTALTVEVVPLDKEDPRRWG